MYIRFIVLIALLHSYAAKAQTRHIVTAGKLTELLKFTEKDSVLYLERLTAIYFHQQLNDYRISKKLHAIGWDDTLWLASRNHNIWLEHHHEMTHTQKEKTKFYTGKSPGERLNYAAENNKKTSYWSGENCLQNYPAFGKHTIEDQAKAMAKVALNQWINSEGHHKNMLSTNHKKHGIAFSFSRLVYATNLFSSGETVQKNPYQLPPFKTDKAPIYAQNKQVINFASLESETEEELVFVPASSKSDQKAKKVNTLSFKKDMENSFYYLKIKESLAGNAKSDVHLKKQSEKMAIELLNTSLKDKTLMKEVVGENLWFKSFTKEIEQDFIGQIFSKQKKKQIAILAGIRLDSYSSETLSATIMNQWKVALLQFAPVFKKYGYHVAVKKKKEQFFVCAMMVVK
jgi:hypothetical protein